MGLKGHWMMRIGLMAAAMVLLAGTVHAQSDRQFYDELYCHDLSRAEYQSLVDYRNNVELEVAEQRADGYLCANRIQQICDSRRDTIRKQARMIYEGLGPKAGVRDMDAAHFAKFADTMNAMSISQCVDMVRR